jgi:hypothetical protein
VRQENTGSAPAGAAAEGVGGELFRQVMVAAPGQQIMIHLAEIGSVKAFKYLRVHAITSFHPFRREKPGNLTKNGREIFPSVNF